MEECMFPRLIPKQMLRRLSKSWKAPSRSFDAVRVILLLLCCGVLLHGAERPSQSIAPRRPGVPENGQGHPIDAFVARYVKAKGVPFPATASDAAFLRRAWLDLTGLLPSPEQQDSFARDRLGTKRTQLIDRLLQQDRKYAEHWITLWNDLLRNEDGVAYPGETREWITDWLLQALEANMPYDRMVRSLLNPDEKDAPRGFLAGIN